MRPTPPDRPAQIEFLFFDAGGGHRSAATALQAVIQDSGRPWQVDLVNLQDVFDGIDVFRKVTGRRAQDLYNALLQKGWTLGSEQMLKASRAVADRFFDRQVNTLRAHFAERRPDLVVSLIPNFNRVLLQAYRDACPGRPYVTILTDFADFPPRFWIEEEQDQDFICGTPRALEQARSMGHSPERTALVSGMILRPQFYERPAVRVAAERERLGLRPDLPTGLLLFGGHGSAAMAKIVRELQGVGRDLQLIALCGRNEKLAAHLRALRSGLRHPLHVEGFTNAVPHFMRLSDFLIGKPGPGSISEAMAMHLPVLVECNAWTLPQERYNAEWVREQGVGIVVNDFREICGAVDELLRPGVLERYQAATRQIENRAVFEIPPLLQRLLAGQHVNTAYTVSGH